MATTLRPIGHDDRLSIVDHLDELRKRLVICLIALVVAFGVAFWQNGALLRILNHPYERAVAGRVDHPNRFDREGQTEARLVRSRAGFAEAARGAQQLARAAGTPAARAAAAQIAAGLQRAYAPLPQRVSAQQPVTLGIAEPFTATFAVATYAALLLALPIILYQLYAFVLPAFRPEERRVALPLMAMVPVLFVAGVAFGYFLILPQAVHFLQTFNRESFDVLVQARPFYTFSIVLLLIMGLIFQVPVGMLALARVGLVSSRGLLRNWRYATLITLVIAVLGPGIDPVTTVLEWAPLLFLYFFSIVLVRISEGRSRRHAADEGDPDDEPLAYDSGED